MLEWKVVAVKVCDIHLQTGVQRVPVERWALGHGGTLWLHSPVEQRQVRNRCNKAAAAGFEIPKN